MKYLIILCLLLSGCAYKTPSGQFMCAAPMTNAEFEGGGKINVLGIPESIIVK